jgi:hypothetical protein
MYTPSLVHAYKTAKTRLPITAWIAAVAKNMPQFNDDASIYNAVPVNIKISGAPSASNGNVAVSVAAFEPNWYGTLVESLAKMTQQPASKIAVVSYLGEPINGLTSGQLACIGECDVIDVNTKKPIRLPAVVAPPLKLATNKTSQLTEWWNTSRDELSRQIASSFKGLSMAELAKETMEGGATHQLICSYLTKNTLHNLSWDDFAKTFGKSSTASASDVAGTILDGVRQALVSNQTQVRNFHAISGEASLWKRGTGAPSHQTKDEMTMYRDIVEDALYHAMIGHSVIHSILYGINKGQSKPRQQNTQSEPLSDRRRLAIPQERPRNGQEEEYEEQEWERPLKEKEEEDDDYFDMGHPVTAYYRDYHQKVHGKLPNHHIEALNKGYGKVEAKYPGNPNKVLELFNLYSGRSVIGCNACKKKKKKPQRRDYDEPIERKLIPITASLQMPKLIPIGDAAEPTALPKLIPIDMSAVEVPPVVRHMPKLVPISSLTQQLPPLIQMGTGNFSEDYEPTLDDFM